MPSRRPLHRLTATYLLLAAVSSQAQNLMGLADTGLGTSRNLGIATSPGFTVQTFADLPLSALEGLDFQPGTGRLFAVGGPAPVHLFGLTARSGAFQDLGSTGFGRISALAFSEDGALYGAGTSQAGGPATSLVLINPFGGLSIAVGNFGQSGGLPIRGIEAMAFDPDTGSFLGVAGAAFDGQEGTLVMIDRFFGLASVVGPITDATGLRPPAPVTGLGRVQGGHVAAALGGTDGRLIDIDLASRQFSFIGDSGDLGLSALTTLPRSRLTALGSDFLFDTRVLAVTGRPYSVIETGMAGIADLQGLSYQPASGRLFASSGAVDGGRLYEINPATSQATLVGATGFASVQALAFDESARLFGAARLAGAPSGAANHLVEVNAFTGQGTDIGGFGSFLGQPIDGMEALAFDAIGRRLIGVSSSVGLGNGLVWEIDRTTGIAMFLGALHDASLAPPADRMLGLAFDGEGGCFGSLDGSSGVVSIDLQTFEFKVLGSIPTFGPVPDLASFHLPCVNLGFGKGSGTQPPPRLSSLGSLSPGGVASFRLEGTPMGTLVVLVLGTSVQPVPFLGGLLAPSPIIVPGAFNTDSQGRLTLFQEGGSFPPGFAGAMQFVVYDPSATLQTTLSNALLFYYPGRQASPPPVGPRSRWDRSTR